MKKLTLLLVTSLFVYGCGNSNINSVKNQKTQNENFTYGQVLDKMDGCKKISWTQDKDKFDRTTVQFKCEVKNNEEKLQALKDKMLESNEKTGKGFRLRVDQRKEELTNRVNEITERNKNGDVRYGDEDYHKQLVGAINKIDEKKNDYISKTNEVELARKEKIIEIFSKEHKLEFILNFLLVDGIAKPSSTKWVYNGNEIPNTFEDAVFLGFIFNGFGSNNTANYMEKILLNKLEFSELPKYKKFCDDLSTCYE